MQNIQETRADDGACCDASDRGAQHDEAIGAVSSRLRLSLESALTGRPECCWDIDAW